MLCKVWQREPMCGLQKATTAIFKAACLLAYWWFTEAEPISHAARATRTMVWAFADWLSYFH